MKDLITEVIEATKQQGSNTGASASGGSVFNSSIPSVMDVRHRLMR